jgi:aryl-alcohol dehydrogenase-like predicted oxidoreductase
MSKKFMISSTNWKKIAAPHQGTISQAALNYLLGKPGVSSVVVGIRTPEQMADNLKTTEWEMTPGRNLQAG